MNGPDEHDVARFLAAVRCKLSSSAVRATAFTLADALTDGGHGNRRENRMLMEKILQKGAEAVMKGE